MSTYALDAAAQGLRSTGVVEPVFDWVEDASSGRRVQTDTQARSEDGQLLWAVEVLYRAEAYGRASTATGRVTVPAAVAPAPQPFEPVLFTGLTVTVTVNRQTGALRESWRATGIPAASVSSRRDAA